MEVYPQQLQVTVCGGRLFIHALFPNHRDVDCTRFKSAMIKDLLCDEKLDDLK